MRDIMYLGSSPSEEDCAQFGEPGYYARAHDECERLITLFRKRHGDEPEGAKFLVKRCPHDFGTYLEVVCQFDTDDERSMAYALRCENDPPETWDE